MIKASVKGQMILWEFISAYNVFGGQLGYSENNSQKYIKIKIITVLILNTIKNIYIDIHLFFPLPGYQFLPSIYEVRPTEKITFQWQTINELQRAGSTSSWIIFNFFTSTKTSRITLVSTSNGSEIFGVL